MSNLHTEYRDNTGLMTPNIEMMPNVEMIQVSGCDQHVEPVDMVSGG